MLRFFKGLVSRAIPTESITSIFRHGTHQVATRVASFLSRHEQRLSIRSKKVILALFFLSVSAFAGTRIYQAFAGPPNQDASYLHLPSIAPHALGRLPDSLSLRLIRRQALLSDSSIHK